MRVAGILLGGGASRRFGADKLAAEIDGRRLAEVACENFLAGGLDPVVFVGRLEIRDPRVRVREPGKTMIETLRSGLAAVPEGPFAFAPADMPALRPGLVRELVEAWERSGRGYLVPNFRGHRGHPAFARERRHFLELGDAEGAREVWQAVAGEVCNHAVATADVLFDVDTPEDLAAAGSEAERYDRLVARGALRR